MNDDNFLETLATSLNQNASVKNVFGEPVRAGDKVIIPVAQVMLGMGGGFGHSNHKNKQLMLPDPARKVPANGPETPDEGAGGGGGMRLIAKGVFEITPKRTRFIPVYDAKEILVSVVAGLLLGRLAVSGLLGKRR